MFPVLLTKISGWIAYVEVSSVKIVSIIYKVQICLDGDNVGVCVWRGEFFKNTDISPVHRNLLSTVNYFKSIHLVASTRNSLLTSCAASKIRKCPQRSHLGH